MPIQGTLLASGLSGGVTYTHLIWEMDYKVVYHPTLVRKVRSRYFMGQVSLTIKGFSS